MTNISKKLSDEDKEKLERLYKNLDHISKVYLHYETTILSWEAIYALVVGQLIIAYVGLRELSTFGWAIIIAGFFLSLCWALWEISTLSKAKQRVQDIEYLENSIRGLLGNEPFYGLVLDKKKISIAFYLRNVPPVALLIIWIILFLQWIILFLQSR